MTDRPTDIREALAEAIDTARRNDDAVRLELETAEALALELAGTGELGESQAPEPASRHFRARYRVWYRDEPDRARTYEAWIGAAHGPAARELLAARLTDPDVTDWELVELVDATAGEPGVLATWAF